MPIHPEDLRRFVMQDDPVSAMGVRGRLVGLIHASSFTIEYIHEPEGLPMGPGRLKSADEFGMFLKPKAAARTLYGLDREVLLWCSTHREFQARDIDKLTALTNAHGARLSRQFAILVTSYERGARSALEAEASRDQTLVHVSMTELASDGLDTLLSRHLYSRDLFDVAGATLRGADFFGRRDLIDRISSEVEVGTSQVGVFGLRKVGKTSLLNRIADKLQNSGRVVVARLDLQWTTAINEAPEYTLWAMGDSIYASHRTMRSIKGLRMFGKYKVFSDIPDPSSTWELFAHDLRLIAADGRRRVCVLVDEVERMFEAPERRGFVRFWRLLRGLDQERPGVLRLIVGGTSPQCSELGQVAGEDNPLFNYLKIEYLGPLSVSDGAALLNTIGGTMGLSFDDGALRWSLRQCGGHPALLRALGSVAHRQELDRSAPVTLTAERLSESETVLRQRVAPILDQMLASLRDQYPDESELLEDLSRGRVYLFREYAAAFPAEVQRLSNYGLVSRADPPSIIISQLHSHLLRAAERKERQSENSPVLLPQGAYLGEWEVQEVIARGGYATVYRVTDGANVAAAKAIHCGQLSQLQREMDVLTELDHPGIVRFFDSMLSEGGTPCLVMEYLEGKAAAEYCTPSARPGTAVLLGWLRQVLEALQSIHPRLDVARQLESAEALDSVGFASWNRAKHGYVHRDIKPENIIIVPGRGPVLIDFNISVRAGAPVLTTSASLGYSAGLPVAWEPSADLYALGVTLLELAAGQRRSTCSLEELRAIAAANHGVGFDELVKPLLLAPESDSCAADILRLPHLRRK